MIRDMITHMEGVSTSDVRSAAKRYRDARDRSLREIDADRRSHAALESVAEEKIAAADLLRICREWVGGCHV